MSSTPTCRSFDNARHAAAMAGERPSSRRCETNDVSADSVPPCTNTQRSRGTPKRDAASAEQRISAAAWSRSQLEHIAFVYGNATIRLAADGSRISAAVIGLRVHAYGLATATSL